MSIRLLLIVGLLAGAAQSAATDEATRYARIIDSNMDRIPLQTIAPEYPRKARRDRIEGEVSVCFDIDRSGRTRRIAVRRSSHRLFEKPSIRAVRASTFRPLQDHEPLPAPKACRTFIFSLIPIELSEPLDAHQ